MNPVDEFIESYKDRYFAYDKTAEVCAQRCRAILQRQGIIAIVTHRAKDSSRIAEKVKRLQTQSPGRLLNSAAEISAVLHDLAGVRIALYFPGDTSAVEELVRGAFDVVPGSRKQFPVTASTEPAGYTRRFPGYGAVHYRVKLNDEDVEKDQGLKNATRLPIEIQIASLLMHAWSEVDHDLIYKQLSGDVSTEEQMLVDQLNGLVRTGELILEHLQRAIEVRVSTAQRVFADEYDLSHFLSPYVRGSSSETSSPRIIGRTDILLGFLRNLGKDRPDALEPVLKCMGTPKAVPVVFQIVEDLLRSDPSAKAALGDAWAMSNDPGDGLEFFDLLLPSNETSVLVGHLLLVRSGQKKWYFCFEDSGVEAIVNTPDLLNKDPEFLVKHLSKMYRSHGFASRGLVEYTTSA